MIREKSRFFYLDVLRIFAISAVILLHCIDSIVVTTPWFGTTSWYTSLVINEITRTGVPLFLMISGYLMLTAPRSADFAFFYKRRLPRLLIPLICWCVIYYVFNALLGQPASVKGFFAQLINNGTAYHMWFVYTLFSIYLIVPFLKRLADTLTVKHLLILVAIIIFPTTVRPLINTVAPVYIFLFNPLLEGYLGYFILGYILGKADMSRAVRILTVSGGIVGCGLGIIGNLLLSSPDNLNLFFNGGYTINHYLFASGLFVVARTLDEHFDAPCFVRRMAAKLSDISFGVYWVHVLVLTLVEKHLPTDLLPIVTASVHFLTVSSVCIALMLGVSYIKPLKKMLM